MGPDGNILSTVVFFLWVPIALWGAKRWPHAKATALLLLIPLLFLPELVDFKVPFLPPLGKRELAVAWLLIGAVLFHRERLGTVPLSNWIKLLMVLLLLGKVCTVLFNGDPISFASVYLPAHQPREAIGAVIGTLLLSIVPFFLGASMFSRPPDLRVLFRVLVGVGLVYSLFQLVELRLSPQLHKWIYGFYQHSFLQTKKASGFRPMVFMSHGLELAMFNLVCVIAAAALYKVKVKIGRITAGWALAYLWLILFVSKSLAVFFYSVLAVPLVLFTSPKTQFRAAALLGVVVLAYPAIRGADLIPVESIAEVVSAKVNEKRADSLMTRFEHEKQLFEHANERPLFGWGGYCRSCIQDEWSGSQTSVSDGGWIVTWGRFGLIGFFAKHLLLFWPIIFSWRRLRRIRRQSDRRLLAALAVMIGFSLFDLLPNGNYNYLPMLLSGALFGATIGSERYETRKRNAKRARALARREDAPGRVPDPAPVAHVARQG